MTPITLCKKDSDVPDSFAPNSILMNGGSKAIKLRQEKIVEKIVEVDKTYFKTFKGIVQGKSLKDLADFATRCDCVGAILSYDEGSSLFTIWNGDPTGNWWNPYEYDESPSDYNFYGDLIAVCIGEGIWSIHKEMWFGHDQNNQMNWAHRASNLYDNILYDCIKGNGYENTKYVMTNHAYEIMYWDPADYDDKKNIWFELSNASITGLKQWIFDHDNEELAQVGDIYLPSEKEMFTILTNCADYTGTGEDYHGGSGLNFTCNISNFIGLSNFSWLTSTQSYNWGKCRVCGNDSSSYGINTFAYDKYTYVCSIVCLHFPDPKSK